ncbi:MAG: glycoside hydrolase family 28 protein [Prolixibacteraceae bacterium]
MNKVKTGRKIEWFLYIGIFLMPFISCTAAKTNWPDTSHILAQIKAPVFPEKIVDITSFGAKSDGSNSTLAINNAIKACHDEGGGTVHVPAGSFYTGAIHLLSNVNLNLAEGAVLSFSVDPQDYLPLVYTRWEGIDCYNYSPLIYANGQTNIGLTGKGTLQGNSTENNWWPWKGKTEFGWNESLPSQLLPHARPALEKYNANELPVEERRMGDGFYLRPQFVNFVHCKNVLIEDITIENSPFWVVHPLFVENLTVRGVRINSLGPNNDGCDPESCKNVLIENCRFNTGDDCIAIKSGRNRDGLKANLPSENIIVRNCYMENGHGGVVLGSEISGGVRNVFVENCSMDSPELDRAIRIKTNSNRGGLVENIYVKNVKIGQVKEAILRINCVYDIKKEGTDTLYPTIRNVNLSEIDCQSSKYGILLEGIESHNSIYGIHITQSKFNGVAKGNTIRNAADVTFDEVYINNKLILSE